MYYVPYSILFWRSPQFCILLFYLVIYSSFYISSIIFYLSFENLPSLIILLRMLNILNKPMQFSNNPNKAKVTGPSFKNLIIVILDNNIENRSTYLTKAKISNLCLLLFVIKDLSKPNVLSC